MNEIMKSLFARKSVRSYTGEVTAQEKESILAAALQAPTAGNMTLYTILDITDPEKKLRLSESCDHQPFIAQAPLVLVFCADYRRWYNLFTAHVSQVRKPAEGDLFLAMADTVIAAQNAVAAAESLGIGSCYIGDILENYEIHRELLSLPQYVLPVCMLCFGRPTQQQLDREKPPRFHVEDIVHQNGYQPEKSAAMAAMLRERQGLTEAELEDWVQKFCRRKWNSDFSVEMSRSVKVMLDSWLA